MDASPIVWLVPLFAIFASGYCFHVSREFSPAIRVLVSAHGLLSFAVFPAALYVDAPLLAADVGFAGVGVNGISILAFASLVFSFVKIKGIASVIVIQVLMIPTIMLFNLAGAVLIVGFG